jgi:soluble lytic murein transglycosylase-like protein
MLHRLGAILFVVTSLLILTIPTNTLTKDISTKNYISRVKIQYVFTDSYQLNSEMKKLNDYIKICNRRIPKEVRKIIAWEIVMQSKESNVDVDLLTAIIDVESTFYPTAKSKHKAKGLMQVLREDRVVIDPNRVYDIKYNIQTGIKILKSKLKKSKGNLNLALRYYVGSKHSNKYPSKVERRRKNYKKFLTSKG